MIVSRGIESVSVNHPGKNGGGGVIGSARASGGILGKLLLSQTGGSHHGSISGSEKGGVSLERLSTFILTIYPTLVRRFTILGFFFFLLSHSGNWLLICFLVLL